MWDVAAPLPLLVIADLLGFEEDAHDDLLRWSDDMLRATTLGPDPEIAQAAFEAWTGFRELRDHFQLGVNFTGSTVNRHIIELFVLDSRGEIAIAFTRLQWDIQEVLEQARALLGLE